MLFIKIYKFYYRLIFISILLVNYFPYNLYSSTTTVEDSQVLSDFDVISECNSYLFKMEFARFSDQCISNFELKTKYLNDIYSNQYMSIYSYINLKFYDSIKYLDLANEGYKYVINHKELFSNEMFYDIKKGYISSVLEQLEVEMLLPNTSRKITSLISQLKIIIEDLDDNCYQLYPVLYFNYLGLLSNEKNIENAFQFDELECSREINWNNEFLFYVTNLVDPKAEKWVHNLITSSNYSESNDFYLKFFVDIDSFYISLANETKYKKDTSDMFQKFKKLYLGILQDQSLPPLFKAELFWLRAVLYAINDNSIESISDFNRACNLLKTGNSVVDPKKAFHNYSIFNIDTSVKINEAYSMSKCLN